MRRSAKRDAFLVVASRTVQLTNQKAKGGRREATGAAERRDDRSRCADRILAEVANSRAPAAGDQPVPLEALAYRCVTHFSATTRLTAGSAWGGTGSFRDLLARGLPEDIRLTGNPPYFVYDAKRAVQTEAPRIENGAPSRPATRCPAPSPSAPRQPIMQARARALSVVNPLSEPTLRRSGPPLRCSADRWPGTVRYPLGPARGSPRQQAPGVAAARPRAPRPSSSRSPASTKRASADAVATGLPQRCST
jgi:hypothetical protein